MNAENTKLSKKVLDNLEKMSVKEKIKLIIFISNQMTDMAITENPGEAERFFEIAKTTGNTEAIARAYIIMSNEQYFQNNNKNSKSELKQQIDILPDKSSCKAYGTLLLANIYFNEGDIMHALEIYKYATVLLEASGKLNESMITYEQIINIYIDEKNYNQAIETTNFILKYFEKTGNISHISSQYVTLSKIYYYLKNLPLAKKYFQKVLELFKQLGPELEISDLFFGYTLYMSCNDNDSALIILNKATELSIERNDIKNIGICNMNTGDHFVVLKNYNRAEDYYLKALEINNANKITNGISYLMFKLANLKSIQHQFEEAEKYYMEAIDLDEKSSNLFGLSHGYVGMADINMRLKNYKKALIFYKKALDIAKKIKNAQASARGLLNISICYKHMVDYKNALMYYEKFHMYSDSVFNESKHKQITELLTKYETQKKDNEIDLLNNKNKLQKTELSKKEFQRNSFIIGFLLMIGFFIVVFVNYRQKKKAHQIIKEKNQNLEMAQSEILAQRDEIETQRDIVIKHKEQIEAINTNLTDSINYAKRIQNAVLSSGGYLQNILGEHFILFKPKDIVSGDFYWATRINELFVITVADCTGHGVPGAFMSMLGVSFLNEIVRKREITKASDVLNHLRESIIDALQQSGTFGEQKDGMDIALCIINMNTLEMQFAGANNPVFIVSNQQSAVLPTGRQVGNQQPFSGLQTVDCGLTELKGDKMPIGIHSNMQTFTNQLYQLKKGDTIYLMSDGFEDQFGGPNRKKFLSKNLKNLLIANCQLPITDQKQILETTISEWIGTGEQIDDITILGIKI